MPARERLPELLRGPFRRRVGGYIVMQDSAGAQIHDDEYVQRSERGGNHHEEVARRDRQSVVADESQPPLLWIRGGEPVHRRGGTFRLCEAIPECRASASIRWRFVPHPGRIPGCHLSDQLTQVLSKAPSSRRPGFPSPKQTEALPVPADERVRFHIPQSIAPGEHSAESCHHPARGIISPFWFNLPFLKQRQLLPEEQILSGKRAPRADPRNDKTAEIEKHDHRSNETMSESGEQNLRRGHNAQDRTLRGRYKILRMLRTRFLRMTTVPPFGRTENHLRHPGVP